MYKRQLFPPPPAVGPTPGAAGPAEPPEPPEPPEPVEPSEAASRRPLGAYVAAGVVAAAAVGVGFAGVHLSDSLRGSDNGTAVQPVVGTDGSGGQVPGIEGSGLSLIHISMCIRDRVCSMATNDSP